MKLRDNPKSSWSIAILISELDAEGFEVEHAIEHVTGHQIKQIPSKQAIGDSLAMIFCHLLDRIAHLFMNGWDVGPNVVDPSCGSPARKGVGFVGQGDLDPRKFAGLDGSHAPG